MGLPADIDRAFQHVSTALDLLEAAVHRRSEKDLVRSNLGDEIAILQDDRSRLAVELDGALARGKSLSASNQEISIRLERASSSIRAILEHAEPVD